MRVRVVVALVAGVLSLTASLAAQTRPAGVIDGLVTDTNLVTLNDATVSILGSGVRVSTGGNGRFRIVGLRRGNYILAVHHIGFVPIAVAMAVAEHDTLRPSFELQRITRELDTMIVTAKSITARMNEFEDRRKAGVGYFITADDLERRNTIVVADVIRTIPSVGIASRMFTQYAVNIRGGGCRFQVYLDGLPMPTPTDLNLLPRPSDLAGIEIYSGPATVPLQYSFQGACGVILFWTKSGE
jgi:hypothetical protein